MENGGVFDNITYFMKLHTQIQDLKEFFLYLLCSCIYMFLPVYTSFLNNLDTAGRTEMGLWLDRSSRFPLLKIGPTRAVFQLSGNFPVLIEELKILQRDCDIIGKATLIK